MSILTLSLPFPPSSNHAYAHCIRWKKGKPIAIRYLDGRAKAWIEEASPFLDGIEPIATRVKMTFEFEQPTVRDRDVGNFEKLITDLLVKKGILKDDSYQYVQQITLRWLDRKGKNVHITIEEADSQDFLPKK